MLMWEHLGELTGYAIWKELRLTRERKWRFDFAVTDPLSAKKWFAIEIEGGAFSRGRHTRGVGFIKDCEKYNHAALLGWRVLRFVPSQVLDGTAIAFIKRVLEEGK